jgi:hypothetical protein
LSDGARKGPPSRTYLLLQLALAALAANRGYTTHIVDDLRRVTRRVAIDVTLDPKTIQLLSRQPAPR